MHLPTLPLAALAAASSLFIPLVYPQSTFQNPVIWDDLADTEVIRVNSTYYYTASTMHYSPGAPILQSPDLISWTYAGHSVPSLDFDDPAYNLSLPSSRAYVAGIWASTLRYRESDNHFYWLGCIQSVGQTYIYRSPAASGPWVKYSVIDKCYYDSGLLFTTEDDIPYVAYGAYTITLAQLSADLQSEVSSTVIWPDTGTYLEGARLYEKGGYFYVALTRPPDAEFVLKSTGSDITGPYEIRTLVDIIAAPVEGAGSPHQGGFVDTPDGRWYYMAFIDAYPGGRIPVLAPLTWSSDGWPSITPSPFGTWDMTYPLPHPEVSPSPPSNHTIDTFSASTLSHEWEWNHNPDPTFFSLPSPDCCDSGLILKTATITTDLSQARNTLTHRIRGPQGTGTFLLNIREMAAGDRAGAVLLRDMSAYIGVWKTSHDTPASLVMVNDITLSQDGWGTVSEGSVAATGPEIPSGVEEVFLRITTDIRPAGTKVASFLYSFNGVEFTSLGPNFVMGTDWRFFMGPRYGVFNFATERLGGSVTVRRFTQEVES